VREAAVRRRPSVGGGDGVLGDAKVKQGWGVEGHEGVSGTQRERESEKREREREREAREERERERGARARAREETDKKKKAYSTVLSHGRRQAFGYSNSYILRPIP